MADLGGSWTTNSTFELGYNQFIPFRGRVTRKSKRGSKKCVAIRAGTWIGQIAYSYIAFDGEEIPASDVADVSFS